jgi:hypothetical protein
MTQMAYFVETRDHASEIKFLVDLNTAQSIRSWARQKLPADPHGSGLFGDEYLITSLYFDTADFSVFRQIGSYKRSKYRIRRYGENDMVFLERKMRTRKVLSKRRTLVPTKDLFRLAGNHVDPEWKGAWFHKRLQKRHFSPVIQTSYRRNARVAETELGIVRLTIDEDLRALPIENLSFHRFGSGDRVLDNQAIVEFKFRLAMPAVFKELVEQFGIKSQRVSKYRMSAVTTGLVSPLVFASIMETDEKEAAACFHS